jgi:hypothetical protein
VCDCVCICVCDENIIEMEHRKHTLFSNKPASNGSMAAPLARSRPDGHVCWSFLSSSVDFDPMSLLTCSLVFCLDDFLVFFEAIAVFVSRQCYCYRLVKLLVAKLVDKASQAIPSSGRMEGII